MSDQNTAERTATRSGYWQEIGLVWLDLVLCTSIILALQYLVLPHFIWYQKFDASHRFWAQLTPVWVVCVLFPIFFRRKARRAQLAAFRADLRQGRVRRISLTLRSAVMLAALGLVVSGSLLQGPYSLACLVLGVPTLLLFGLEELNIILRPGDSVFSTDQHDELVAFFRARTLRVGYSIAILSLLTLFLVSLLANQYVRTLLPILLTLSLLAPSFLYRRLDRQAEADE